MSSSSTEGQTSLYIIQHPQDNATTAGSFEAALFSVLASFYEGVSYAWQWSTDGGNTWYDINPDGGVFFQANTDVLGINPGMTDVSSTWNGSRFRAKITYEGVTIYSESAALTVNAASAPSSSSTAPPASFSISQQPQNYSAIAAEFEPYMFTVAVDSSDPVVYAWQWSLDGGGTWYDINPNGGVFFQADTSSLGIYPGMTDTSSTWNGSKFRAKVTSGGVTLFSEPATLTVTSGI